MYTQTEDLVNTLTEQVNNFDATSKDGKLQNFILTKFQDLVQTLENNSNKEERWQSLSTRMEETTAKMVEKTIIQLKSSPKTILPLAKSVLNKSEHTRLGQREDYANLKQAIKSSTAQNREVIRYTTEELNWLTKGFETFINDLPRYKDQNRLEHKVGTLTFAECLTSIRAIKSDWHEKTIKALQSDLVNFLQQEISVGNKDAEQAATTLIQKGEEETGLMSEYANRLRQALKTDESTKVAVNVPEVALDHEENAQRPCFAPPKDVKPYTMDENAKEKWENFDKRITQYYTPVKRGAQRVQAMAEQMDTEFGEETTNWLACLPLEGAAELFDLAHWHLFEENWDKFSEEVQNYLRKTGADQRPEHVAKVIDSYFEARNQNEPKYKGQEWRFYHTASFNGFRQFCGDRIRKQRELHKHDKT